MRTVTMADGSVHEVFRCGAADGVLWIGPEGMDEAEIRQVFGDPGKTAEITASDALGVTVYRGYTELTGIITKTRGPVAALEKRTKEDQHGEDD